MTGFGSFLYMELKRMRTHLIPMFAGTILIIGMIAAVLLLFVKNDTSGKVEQTRVGLVMGDEGVFSRFVTDAMNSLGEIGEAFSFEEMSEDEGNRLLEQGELTSLFIVPDGYVESLILGTNKPVVVRYAATRAGLPSLLIRQLVQSATSYIINTEAGIYAIKDWYKSLGIQLPVKNESELNWKYLNMLIARSNTIREELIDTKESLSLADYYIVCGIALWLLIIGLCCRGMIGGSSGSISALLNSKGVSFVKQSFAQGVAFLITYGQYYIIVMIPLTIVGVFVFDIPVYSGIIILPAVWLGASFIRLIFTVINDRVYSLMVLLLLILAFGFASGYFYPIQYLPDSIRTVGEWLPTRQMFFVIRNIFTGDILLFPMMAAIIYAVCFDVLSILIGSRYRSGRWS